MNRKFVLLVSFLALVAAACGGVDTGKDDQNIADLEIAPVSGSLAPDFKLETLAGDQVSLSDFNGHPVLINFWATWCAPCRIEMPALQAAEDAFGPDLVILAVDFDESAEIVADFFLELELSFDPLLDPGGKIQRLYQVRGYPSTFIIDRQGVIQFVHIGLMTENQLDGYLTELGLKGLVAR